VIGEEGSRGNEKADGDLVSLSALASSHLGIWISYVFKNLY
jgi:hypothetical protein